MGSILKCVLPFFRFRVFFLSFDVTFETFLKSCGKSEGGFRKNKFPIIHMCLSLDYIKYELNPRVEQLVVHFLSLYDYKFLILSSKVVKRKVVIRQLCVR